MNKRFEMKLIDLPAWVETTEVWFQNFTLAQYEECKKHRREILEKVHREIEAYVNDDDLTFDDEDTFPSRGRLSGEYYIENFQSSYECHVEPSLVSNWNLGALPRIRITWNLQEP